MYLPYQDIYLRSAITTSSTKLDDVYYFIARLNGEFLGYQAAVKTGNYLNALHGAFDRERKTTYHSYDLLFVEMVKFAIENDFSMIDFGSVINTTNQRAVNNVVAMSYFLFSKYTLIQLILKKLLKISKIQREKQMQYNKS